MRESPEEGEIPEEGVSKPAPWGDKDIAWMWLNLALFEALSEATQESFVCCEQALSAADGLHQVTLSCTANWPLTASKYRSIF